MARLYPDPAPKTERTIRDGAAVKIDGTWRRGGAVVALTDAEAETYGHALRGGSGESAGPLPGQEPQEPTPIPGLMAAQAKAGDKLMKREVKRRKAAGARVLDSGDGTAYNARVMKAAPPPGEAYPPGGEPQEPTRPTMDTADGPVPAPEAQTPMVEDGPASVTHTGGGWYEVRTAAGVEKVQGREAAEALAQG